MKILEYANMIRFLSFIPLSLVLYPLIRSYLEKKNTLNGLRPTRLALIMLFSGLFISNVYFFVFSLFNLSRSTTMSQYVTLFDKILTFIAYTTMYLLFRHASKHKK